MNTISPLQRVVGRTASSRSRQAAVSRASPAVVACHLPPQVLRVVQGGDEQRRSFWMDVVTRKPQQGGRYAKQRQQQKQQQQQSDNHQKEKFVHEDPEQIIRRHTDETRSDGLGLLDLMFYNDRHEKAWRKRQRLQGIKRYEFDKKHVNDLAKYISFVKDNNE